MRENLRNFKSLPLLKVLNMSINNTLSRTIMTSVTTLLANKVVTEVIIVLLKVLFIDMFKTFSNGNDLKFLRFSRTRSNTTTVSFKE